MTRQLIFPIFLLSLLTLTEHTLAQPSIKPDQIQFVRQSVRRFIFDEKQQISLAALNPSEVIGIDAMYPVSSYSENEASVTISNHQLVIQSEQNAETSIWFGGFNPFAVYTIDIAAIAGTGEIGFEFSGKEKTAQCFITLHHEGEQITDVRFRMMEDSKEVINSSFAYSQNEKPGLKGRVVLQMLGSGFTLFIQDDELPQPLGHFDYSQHIDLREKRYLNTFQSNLYLRQKQSKVVINKVSSTLSSGMGLADIRAITYENGEPLLDEGRLWYTMSIRGRALPHHVQGVFSLDPSVFDLRFEGVILFDRNDGLLRNEIASHIFYDRKANIWRGLTTGFSAFANPKEEKQLLAVESKKDPRFGFSVMKASPFGIVGDIEDPHILFDSIANKWRILTCENHDGYKAVMLESDTWNKGYQRIAGPVSHNSTGTSIQRIGSKRYCFSGSSEREIFIYSYPDLKEAGTLKMNLPPWDQESGTRVWPNVVELPEGYPFRYVALMMDRYNYPGLQGPNWTYGALYLYHGF